MYTRYTQRAGFMPDMENAGVNAESAWVNVLNVQPFVFY